MSAIKYMRKQYEKHSKSYTVAKRRGDSQEVLANIRAKVSYYARAVEALEIVESMRSEEATESCQ